jgi:hypothetical protein
VASADLGGLGAEDGPAIPCQWSPPGLIFGMLPWLAVLWPLGLRRNRSLQVLWVALPLVISLALGWLIAMTPLAWPLFPPLFNAMALGLAAVWLLLPFFGRKGRFLSFLGTLLSMDLSGLFVIAAGRPWSNENERLVLTVGVCIFGAILTLALHLAGLSCRGRFGQGRLLARLLPCVLGCCVVAVAITAAGASLWEMARVSLTMVASSLALLLPFVVLSFVNGLFRDRLKQVLRLDSAQVGRGA